MKDKKNIKEIFKSNFNEFEDRLNGESKTEFHKLRKNAFDHFSNLNFPNNKDEEWRYTNISPLVNNNFVIPSNNIEFNDDDISKYFLKDIDAYKIIFVNGRFSSEHSDIKDLEEGLEIKSIAECIKSNQKDFLKYLGKNADYRNDIFTSLNTAFTNDGVFLKVNSNCIIEKPIYILYLTKTEDLHLQIHPRNLIVAAKNSHFTVIEHFSSTDDSTYFTNAITEIVSDENSVIDHIKLQEESRNSFHISRLEVEQKRSSNFTSHLISIGSKISRNNLNSTFKDEGGEAMMNGLFLIEEDQLFDVHSMIDHAKPHCESHEHFKGILDNSSRGVFNGKIMVRKDAQKTNAFQENNNILLSDEALINTKPQLEIFADDVKCSHGATIGQLDENAKFYLKSRGIGEEASKVILLHAFASDVINHIKVDAVKKYTEEIITKRINKRMK